MKTRPLTIITGASRGLGRAIAEQRLVAGHRVLAIARSTSGLAAAVGGDGLVEWQADLADPVPVAARLAQWLQALDPATLESAALINNAAIVSRPAPLALTGEGDAGELSQAIRIGLEAPLLLTAAFLRATAAWKLTRKVMFISSGLGRYPMAGSASYCASKAGLDHLARALALEEAAQERGARVCSLAPGVIDTDMQARLRGADPAVFAERARFAEMHATGRLDTPEQAAAKVLRVLDHPDYGREPIADVRNA